jgi:hypothetical protein
VKNRWTTRNELSFIDGIGTFTQSPALTPASKLARLMGYAEGLRHRSIWDEIDPHAVSNHVRFKIAVLLARHKETH